KIAAISQRFFHDVLCLEQRERNGYKNESCSFKEEIEEIKKWINEREGLTKHAGIYSEHKKSH
ncbi:hypothetical protein, partial [Mediterraneibacter gnavus]|uniref:hypothetical protein n=1 Tax=Mediterraneibacter gnavus TaxID=33038 RepID=UPI00374E768E